MISPFLPLDPFQVECWTKGAWKQILFFLSNGGSKYILNFRIQLIDFYGFYGIFLTVFSIFEIRFKKPMLMIEIHSNRRTDQQIIQKFHRTFRQIFWNFLQQFPKFLPKFCWMFRQILTAEISAEIIVDFNVRPKFLKFLPRFQKIPANIPPIFCQHAKIPLRFC